MPNWTKTSYRIEGSNEVLSKIFTIIDDFMTERRKPNGDYSKDWEGNIIKALGATNKDLEYSFLRGFIQSYNMKDNFLSIEAEEAWSITDFRTLLKQFAPGIIAIYFAVEEPSFGIYTTNDNESKYFRKYLVEAYINNVFRTKYFKCLKDALLFAAQLIGKKNITMNELDIWNTESHLYNDEFVYIHEFNIVND